MGFLGMAKERIRMQQEIMEWGLIKPEYYSSVKS